MKILTTSFLMLVMSMTTLMTTTVFAIEKESEVTTKSEMHKGSGHKEKMGTHMKMMKIQMQAIHEETDPEKRKVLMQAHRQSMHEGMKMMHGKGGHGMMHGKKHKGMKGKTEEMSAHARMQHMEHRMDSMHMMMEQMMQHEDAMHQHSKH